MSIIGIVAEYNPIHNGHLYHITKSKELTNSDFVIVIMSGSFTQSGNISIYDKFTRAKLACETGADLVLELPTLFANSSAEYFAYYSMNLFNSLNIIDYISFGSEADNINILNEIVDVLYSKNEEIWKLINVHLKSGISFANARENVLKLYLSNEQISIISQPNNILGIQYLLSLKKLNSNIHPLLVKRETSHFNETLLNKNKNNYTSATSIRNSIKLKKIIIIKKYVPQSTYNTIQNIKPTFNESIFKLLRFKILTKNIDELKNVNEVTEGLENKLKKEIINSYNYEDFIQNIKSKRYQMSKIKRMLNNILLDITKEDFSLCFNKDIEYAHVLACSEKGKNLLSIISKNSKIKLITSLNSKILNKLTQTSRYIMQKDILASNIYSLANNNDLNTDFTNKLL